MRASEQFQLRNIHFQQQAFHRDRPHLSRNRRYVGLSTQPTTCEKAERQFAGELGQERASRLQFKEGGSTRGARGTREANW